MFSVLGREPSATMEMKKKRVNYMFMFQNLYYIQLITGYRYYYSCCRDGKARQNIWTKRKSNEQRGQGCKKPSRKLNKTCISRIYATQSSNDGRIHVIYISAHTNHSLSIEDEAKNIPLPKTTQREISAKLQKGIPVERIMEGKNSRITCA